MEDRCIGQGMNVAGKKVEHERMVTSQVSDKSLGELPNVGSWPHTGKNSRVSHSKVKEGLFWEIHTPKSLDHLRR